MNRFRSRRGMASAMIIMLLVLLIFFGVLSLVTTAADLRLAQKRADWNKEYYQADNAALQMVAEMDAYCRSLEPAKLQAGTLDGLLENWLAAAANVSDYQLTRGETADAPLVLTARIAENADKGQGIDLQLRLLPVLAGQNSIRIEIEKWVQWQPSFDYSGSEGGVWKG